MRKRLLVVAALCGIAAIGATAATAIPATKTSSQTQIRVGFRLGKFVKQGHHLAALGSVTAMVTTDDGKTQSFTQPFNAHVVKLGKGHSCKVLELRLDKLSLNLLGLHVDLDKVVLSISANPKEGALGSLFCKLARTKVKLHSLAARNRHLTRLLHAAGLSSSSSMLGVAAPMTPQQEAAGATYCPILDLVLGPLHLDLLGLIVDLNQVHLSITADPNGGTLGSLFCSIAGSTTTSTSTTATT